jgi:hypothetical protein
VADVSSFFGLQPAGGGYASMVPTASNPISAGALTHALTKTAENLINGPGGVHEGAANFVGTNSYQNAERPFCTWLVALWPKINSKLVGTPTALYSKVDR